MAMEASNALQQHVNRTQIGDEQISVDVQRLLERLCANNDDPSLRSSPTTDHRLDLMVQQPTVFASEATVMKRGSSSQPEEEREV